MLLPLLKLPQRAALSGSSSSSSSRQHSLRHQQAGMLLPLLRLPQRAALSGGSSSSQRSLRHQQACMLLPARKLPQRAALSSNIQLSTHLQRSRSQPPLSIMMLLGKACKEHTLDSKSSGGSSVCTLQQAQVQQPLLLVLLLSLLPGRARWTTVGTKPERL
jgi:hypothetical protein